MTQAIPDFQKDLPVSVRSLIRSQFDQLDTDDQRLLSVASVQGYEFDAAIAAEVLARNVPDVEERLELLDRVHGLVRLVRELEFPDGTLTLRYRFVHVLYQNSLYAAAPPSRRLQWSAAVALLTHHANRTLWSRGSRSLFEKACARQAVNVSISLSGPCACTPTAGRGAGAGLECARLPDMPERPAGALYRARAGT